MLNRSMRLDLMRAAVALAMLGGVAMLLPRYDAADAGPVPPPGAACDAPIAGPPAPVPVPVNRAPILGQIRYDSGLVLRYCSLARMSAQLRAMEQPGLVRAVYVLGAGGDWRQASPAD